MRIHGTYLPTAWDEKPLEVSAGGMKTTRVSATFAFSGDFKGTCAVDYLMFYTSFDAANSHKAEARYVGLLRFNGTLQGEQGSFAAADEGVYSRGAAQSKLTLIPGSGTAALTKIAGTGSYRADGTGCNWELEIAL